MNKTDTIDKTTKNEKSDKEQKEGPYDKILKDL